jgi:hypothetical protein
MSMNRNDPPHIAAVPPSISQSRVPKLARA